MLDGNDLGLILLGKGRGVQRHCDDHVHQQRDGEGNQQQARDSPAENHAGFPLVPRRPTRLVGLEIRAEEVIAGGGAAVHELGRVG